MPLSTILSKKDTEVTVPRWLPRSAHSARILLVARRLLSRFAWFGRERFAQPQPTFSTQASGLPRTHPVPPIAESIAVRLHPLKPPPPADLDSPQPVTPITVTSPAIPTIRLGKRVAIINQKGGVGKTTTTVNLAGALAEMGQRVLLLDCDSQGDLSSVFLENHEALPYSIADLFAGTGILARDLIQPTPFANITIIPADRRLNAVDQTHGFADRPNVTCIADALAHLEGDFDVVLMDCPPRSHLSAFAALVAADHVLVPVEVESFAVRSLAAVEDDYRAVRASFHPGISIHYFLSKVLPSSKVQNRPRKMLTEALGEQNVFRTAIPLLPTYSAAINSRRPVVFHRRNTRAADVIRRFATEVLSLPPTRHAE